MANYRQVNTFFWDDPYIENLCTDGKLLFVYLITTPLTNIAGSFEITLKKMHDHTDISKEKICDLLKRFEADGKCIYRDHWMFVCNTIDHQHWETHAKIRKGIETIILASPQWVKDRVCIGYEWLSHLKEKNRKESNSSLRDDADASRSDETDESKTRETAETPEEPEKTKQKRGTRIPDPFLVTKDMQTWVAAECPNTDWRTETKKFSNHYRSATGRSATKLNWEMTWENWMLNARDRYGPSKNHHGTDQRNSRPTSADRIAESRSSIAERYESETQTTEP